MEILLKSKSAGKNSTHAVISFLAMAALSFGCIYNGITENHLWWLGLILSIPLMVLSFQYMRDEFAGCENIGVEDNQLIILYDRWYIFKKNKEIRIPLQDIVEIDKPKKSHKKGILHTLSEINDMLSELHGLPVDVDYWEIRTVNGKKYNFGEELSEKQIERLKERLNAYINQDGTDRLFANKPSATLQR